MEMVKLALVLVLLLSNAICGEVDVDDWKEGIKESQLSNSLGIQDILVRMYRKPRQRQYLGLVRRKGSEKTQTARKSHHFQTFVGLMGKRTSDGQGAPRAAGKTEDD